MTKREPRWLSEPEQQTWRSFLAATHCLFEQVNDQLQREAGIPHTYYEILVHLSEARHRALRMSELAERTLSSRSRLSHAVTRLEAQGWVERANCPEDKRGQLAALTPAGLAALKKAAPGHVDQVRATLFDALTPTQVTQLHRITAAICEHAAS